MNYKPRMPKTRLHGPFNLVDFTNDLSIQLCTHHIALIAINRNHIAN